MSKSNTTTLIDFCDYCRSQFPTNKEKVTIGGEFEYPLVGLGEDGEFRLGSVGAVMDHLGRCGWKEILSDGELAGYEQIGNGSGSVVYEFVPWIMELNSPVMESVPQMQNWFERIMPMLSQAASHGNDHILGHGLVPMEVSKQLVAKEYIKLPRYLALFRAYGDRLVHFGHIASVQGHVGVDFERFLDMLNVINRLSCVFIGLFANAPFKGHVAYRVSCWQALGESRSGILPWFDSFEDYMSYIWNENFVFYQEDTGDYDILKDTSFGSFLEQRGISDPLTVLEHFKMHMSCFWPDARLNPKGWTFEHRPVCQQRPSEQFDPILLLSLCAKPDVLAELKDLAQQHDHDFWRDIRQSAILEGVASKAVRQMARQVLGIITHNVGTMEADALGRVLQRVDKGNKDPLPAELALDFINAKDREGFLRKFAFPQTTSQTTLVDVSAAGRT